ncbi:hypothetical protein OG413_16505 [Streptomyces sp. NBC_01433]|uniref:hypothetical protein n=1 Tax=Streptomyces sp. NBC_01433 TaxID=2903864 RepID=UPI0022593CD2|nr:hypothetical protein [Streptomyces sp. NBC_01433]MCX4676885.1 hypothetical protein [Streptomyces sp. NBC_01433]
MQRPEHRKKEIDGLTQRELLRLAFRGMAIQAWSDVTNNAERRAPEKAGPRRWGVVRGSRFRDGACDNGVLLRVARADVA